MKYAYIYGLFRHGDGVCLYIGQTGDPLDRGRHHYCGEVVKGGGFAFRIITTVLYENRLSAESDMIEKYKRVGQAEMNKVWRSAPEDPLLVELFKAMRIEFKMQSRINLSPN